ncbi:MAG: hypothetical protein GXO83_02220 [Chlorobi bacterium]|nr:hypothetical protein [Chlorobiota bacterium]
MKPLKKILGAAIIMIVSAIWCDGQSQVQISKPALTYADHNVIISFDILNSRPEERFNISLEISDSAGNIIHAKTLTGDVGNNIPGGPGKTIVWNLLSDNVLSPTIIFVQINAEPMPTMPVNTNMVITDFSTGKVLLQNAVFPGWGMSGIKKKKPHWIVGVLAYVSLGDAIFFNRLAYHDYNLYRNATTVEEVQRSYDSAVMEKNISRAAAYSAVALWSAEFIRTWIYMKKVKTGKGNLTKLYPAVFPDYDPVSEQPLLTFSISF